jgi:hypothetical protein
MESGQPHHELPTAIVIAQLYSSVSFVSLRFNYCKEMICARSIKFISIDFYVFKLHNFEVA